MGLPVMSTPPSPPPSEPEAPPVLDPIVISDDEALGEAVDEFVRREPEARARLQELVNLQEAIRQSVEPDIWQLILRLDETVTERWADLAVAIARWAFLEGQKHPTTPSEATPCDSASPPRGAT